MCGIAQEGAGFDSRRLTISQRFKDIGWMIYLVENAKRLRIDGTAGVRGIQIYLMVERNTTPCMDGTEVRRRTRSFYGPCGMRTFYRQWYSVALPLLAQSMDQGYGSSRTSRSPYRLLRQNTMAPDHGPIAHFFHVYGEFGPRNTGTAWSSFIGRRFLSKG